MDHKPIAVIIGASSKIAMELCKQLSVNYEVIGISRNFSRCSQAPYSQVMQSDYSEANIQTIADHLKVREIEIDLLICCLGVLHDGQLDKSEQAPGLPEKALAKISEASLEKSFRINAILPTLFLSQLTPLLNKKRNTQLVFLSAMVGSITDNQLGGWYGYRASKAALNMLIKTASIELKRTFPLATIVALHPGTTKTPLSRPFQGNVQKNRLYAPDLSAKRIISIIHQLEPESSGKFLNWDGRTLPW